MLVNRLIILISFGHAGNIWSFGAGGRSRTDTLSPEPDFESGASTNSTTPAKISKTA